MRADSQSSRCLVWWGFGSNWADINQGRALVLTRCYYMPSRRSAEGGLFRDHESCISRGFPEMLLNLLLQKSEGKFFRTNVLVNCPGGFFSGFLFCRLFSWKKNRRKNSTQKSTAKFNQNLGVLRPKSTLQGSALDRNAGICSILKGLASRTSSRGFCRSRDLQQFCEPPAF